MFDLETGKTDFFQVKIVVDETVAIVGEENKNKNDKEYSIKETEDERVHFNAEHHIILEDAKKIKKGVELNDEVIFPLEAKEDYGRIAAQTAKQVIIQKIREAERTSIIDEYGTKEGEIIGGTVQKVERGNVYIDFNRATGILPAEEQIPEELSGEKIDIIPWSEDPKIFVANSISPAKVISIEIDEKEHKATIEVANDQLSLAIGKGGQNVRLAAKLTGWRIDIKGEGEEAVSVETKTEEPEEEKVENKKEE